MPLLRNHDLIIKLKKKSKSTTHHMSRLGYCLLHLANVKAGSGRSALFSLLYRFSDTPPICYILLWKWKIDKAIYWVNTGTALELGAFFVQNDL